MKFTFILIDWYNQNKRDLPWRNTADPYKIWLSEIILQQTRVNQGMSYYLKFAETFPDIVSLANAPEDQILKLWQGLGYYSRARNLHFTAKKIRDEFNGIFPSDPKEIFSLKGIGEYTTAAISSFAFGLPLAVVDGNVVRLLSRFFNIEEPFDTRAGKEIFRVLALRYLDRKDPGTYNQAIMEFGARQCKPGIPDCNECPLQNDCQAFALGTIEKLPVKKKQVKVKVRNFNYLISNKDKNFIRQRIEKDIWQNLYEFPLIETTEKLSDIKLKEELNSEVSLAAMYTHKLSHREINASFWIVKDLKIEYLAKKKNYIKVDHDELNSYPVSRLMEKFIKEKMMIK
ncbi:MAG: A/G-specific adenine glycosylase [Bacteroidia bacterium]